MVRDCDFGEPTAEERDWMNSFETFCKRVDSLKNDRSASAHKQLFLLMWGSVGVLKQNSNFFVKQRHTGGFLDAYTNFGEKALELHKVVNKHIKKDERAKFVEQTKGQVAIDTNTWCEIKTNSRKNWWQFW